MKYKVKEIKDNYGRKSLEEEINKFLEDIGDINLIDIKYHTQMIPLKHMTADARPRSTLRDASALIIYEESK